MTDTSDNVFSDITVASDLVVLFRNFSREAFTF